MKTIKMTHPNCDHNCTSDCRREGCNCLCGEFHGEATPEEIEEALQDEIRDTRIDTVKMILMKYCDPKPQYDGMMGYQLSAKIVDSLFIDPVAVNVMTEKI